MAKLKVKDLKKQFNMPDGAITKDDLRIMSQVATLNNAQRKNESDNAKQIKKTAKQQKTTSPI